MNPALIAMLIKGAVEIVTNKDAFLENLKSKSTKAAAAVVAGGASVGVTMPDSEEAALTQLVTAIVGAALFFYRKSRA